MKDITRAQITAEKLSLRRYHNKIDGICNSIGVRWISNDAKLLQLRIVITSHTDHGGDQAKKITCVNIKAFVYWDNMDDNIDCFVKSCIHSVCTQSWKIIPRPLRHEIHANRPNELLHFNFCYMFPAEGKYLYTLIFKEDHSSYVRLTPTTGTTAEVVAQTMIRWFAAFSTVHQ